MDIREAILSHPPVIESVEAFGRTVHVREMAGHDVASFQQYLKNAPDRTGVATMAELLIRSLCDRAGVRFFSDNEAALVQGLPIQDINRAYSKAEKLNSVTDQDVEAAEGN